MAPANSKESRLATVRWCRKWSMISGMGIMMLTCLHGAGSGTVLDTNRKAFLGAHHQWAHGGEMMVAAAFCFPYLHFELDTTYLVLFGNMFLAMFCNGAAYAVAGFSGDYWLGDTDRKFTNWSMLSLALVPIITGPTCYAAFSMFLYGLWKGDGKSIEETQKEN